MGKIKTVSDKILAFVSSPAFLWLTFFWFIFQAIWMAVSTNLGISPDESYHFGLIRLFALNGWLPTIHNQSGFYELGTVTVTPFVLYHYLLSLPYHLFSKSPHAYEFLRFINIGFGAISFYLSVLLAKQLRVSALVRNISLFMLANTLMFVFLTGAMNYDNLFIPLALLTFLLLFKLFDKFDALTFVGFIVTLLAGSLTVINYLPVGFAAIVILIYKYRARYTEAYKSFIKSWSNKRRLNFVMLIPLVILLVLFGQKYLLNVVRYHTFQPGCTRVNTLSQCRQNGIFDRSVYVADHKMPLHISPMDYLPNWTYNMDNEIYGILGHKSINASRFVRWWTQILIITAPLVLARWYRRERQWDTVILISLFYAFVLFLKNYLKFKSSGFELGEQGRYVLVLMPTLYFLINRYILSALQSKRLQAMYVVITLLIFITASLPTYLAKTSPDWYTPRTTNINTSVSKFLKKFY